MMQVQLQLPDKQLSKRYRFNDKDEIECVIYESDKVRIEVSQTHIEIETDATVAQSMQRALDAFVQQEVLDIELHAGEFEGLHADLEAAQQLEAAMQESVLFEASLLKGGCSMQDIVRAYKQHEAPTRLWTMEATSLKELYEKVYH